MFAPWNLGPTVRITAFTLTGFSTAVVALRYYCRIWVVRKLKLYDYIMLAALICTWGLCVINHYQLLYGTGDGRETPRLDMSKANFTPEKMALYNKTAVAAAVSWFCYRMMYLICLGLVKLSILVFYLSFATQRTFRILTIASIVIVAIFTIVCVFINAFECPQDPGMTLTAKIFDLAEAAKCLNRETLYFCQAGFNMFSDAAILVLPLPSLLQLRMVTFKRWSLIAVFSIGLLVPIASGLRIWGLYIWANNEDAARYNGGYILFWSQVEINTSIICASAPSLQPLFKLIFGRLVSYPTHSAYYYYGDGANTMVEAVGERSRQGGQPSGRITEHNLHDLESPAETYQSNKRSTGGTTEEGFVFVQGLDEEERIRDRIRHFASQGSLRDQKKQSPSPERKTNFLSVG